MGNKLPIIVLRLPLQLMATRGIKITGLTLKLPHWQQITSHYDYLLGINITSLPLRLIFEHKDYILGIKITCVALILPVLH